jgi:hypothetical protein
MESGSFFSLGKLGDLRGNMALYDGGWELGNVSREIWCPA